MKKVDSARCVIDNLKKPQINVTKEKKIGYLDI